MRKRAWKFALGVGAAFMAMGGTALAIPATPLPEPSVPLAVGKYQTVKYTGVSAGNAQFWAAGSAQEYFVKGVTKPNGKLPKKTFTNAVMSFRTATGNGSYPGTGIPNPAVRAIVNFDNDLKFNFAGIEKCDAAAIAGLNTTLARQTCPNSIVGSGTARVRNPWPPELSDGKGYIVLPVQITAFVGLDNAQGQKTVILYSRNEGTGTGAALIGTVSNKKSWATPGSDYGQSLDVDIPLINNGVTVLTEFEVAVGNGFKKGFIKARCADRDKKINTKTRFFFSDGDIGDNQPASYLPANNTMKCKN